MGLGQRGRHRARCWPPCSPFLGALFTDDPAVHDLLVPVLLVAAIGQPVAGVVFVLDGVLIGAGDGRYLAWAGLVVLAAYAPAALCAATLAARAGRGLGRVHHRLHGRPLRGCSSGAPAATRGS